MWTSAEKANTTAQRMPLVKTPTARSSASVTKDIRETASTVHVKVSVHMIAGGERCQYALVKQKTCCPAIAPVLSPNGPLIVTHTLTLTPNRPSPTCSAKHRVSPSTQGHNLAAPSITTAAEPQVALTISILTAKELSRFTAT